jgi:hypothetical protein
MADGVFGFGVPLGAGDRAETASTMYRGARDELTAKSKGPTSRLAGLFRGGREMAMRSMETGIKMAAAITLALALGACESRGGSALLGGAAGAAAGAGGYEYHLQRQRERVQADYDAKTISKSEYDIRMDQLGRDSLVR